MIDRSLNTSLQSRSVRDARDEALFELLPLPDSARQALRRRMTTPDRHYHCIAHLELLWARHCRFAPTSNLRRADHVPIALAIAFHDAVYESGARDNEARSAALWLSVSADGTVCSEADRAWVADTILATADHLAAAAALDPERPDHRARQWVLDLDLTPLGEAPDVFDANMADLAAEMGHVPPAHRRGKLVASLRHFATARPLYRSPVLQHAFEGAAQANIARCLDDPRDGLFAPP